MPEEKYQELELETANFDTLWLAKRALNN